MAGSIGTTIAPGVGTAIGIGGGLAGGFVGGTAIKLAGDHVREDDSVILSRLFNAVVTNLIYEYMLSESEINVVIEKFNAIGSRKFNKLFKDVMAADHQEKVIEKYIRHYYEEVVRSRPKVAEPTPADLVDFVARLAGPEE